MQALMSKLEAIEQETTDAQTKPKTQGGKSAVDEFTRLKREVHREIKAVRVAINERDEMLAKSSGSKHTVEMSARIRAQIKTIREEANRMATIQRQQAAKRRNKNMQEVEHRAEVVELVFSHIEEVEALEKRRYAAKEEQNRTSLFAACGLGGGASSSSGGGGGGGGGGGASTADGLQMVAINMPSGSGGAGPSGLSAAPRDATDTDLPDIDVQEGLQALKQTDARIDQDLDQISSGVSDLRHIALDMKEEVRLQSAMVDEITHKVDGATEHLHSLNKKMKHALKEVRSADRFIIDFILVVILLGIATYIYNMFARNGR